MRTRQEIIAAARGCVGVRFRPQGRDPRYGLDCVGVAAIAYARPVPADYALRGGSRRAIAQVIDATGLTSVALDAAGPGDLLLLEAGAGQLHLAVLTTAGHVHADAGLRHVVETPGRPVQAVLGAWREGK